MACTWHVSSWAQSHQGIVITSRVVAQCRWQGVRSFGGGGGGSRNVNSAAMRAGVMYMQAIE